MTASRPPRFDLDPSVRLTGAGRVLCGGDPPRLLRLTDAGAAVVCALLDGRTVAPDRMRLASRLEEGGLIHPRLDPDAAGPEVTAVIPSLNGGDGLVALVEAVLREGPVIVVDDGSDDGSAARAAAAGARVVTNSGAPGPAGARNTGARVADTDLIAFLDADCAVEPGWRAGMAGLFVADPDLAAAAPRVRSAPEATAIARYERRHSPLDLGKTPGLVAPGRRISYLPTAALIVRRADFIEAGGFDETLRFGEDVDLLWRLVAAGRRARYVPGRVVSHAPRSSPAGFARQRFGYGSSAPDLGARHGNAVAPLQVTRSTAFAWTASAVLGPGAWLAGGSLGVALAVRKGRTAAERRALAGLSLDGQASAARHLGRALCREWLPVTLALTTTRRGRRIALAAALLDGLAAPSSLRALDRAAYAAGLWTRAARRRDVRALLPRVLP